MGVNLCDHKQKIDPKDPRYPQFHVMRTFHDLAVKHGAICDGADGSIVSGS